MSVVTFHCRPALKRMVRNGNNFLQICKQLGALTSQDGTPGKKHFLVNGVWHNGRVAAFRPGDPGSNPVED